MADRAHAMARLGFSSSARSCSAAASRRASLRFEQQELGIELAYHFLGDFILNREQIIRLPVEPPRPDDLVAGPQVEQTQRDAQLVPIALDRPVEQEVDTERPPDRA